MHFDEYQQVARTTAIYPEEEAITYPLLGLIGEVGEFSNKWKKTLRDGATFSQGDMESELGDILWYLSNLAFDCGINFDEMAGSNIDKLKDRQSRGVLGGSGDNR